MHRLTVIFPGINECAALVRGSIVPTRHKQGHHLAFAIQYHHSVFSRLGTTIGVRIVDVSLPPPSFQLVFAFEKEQTTWTISNALHVGAEPPVMPIKWCTRGGGCESEHVIVIYDLDRLVKKCFLDLVLRRLHLLVSCASLAGGGFDKFRLGTDAG
jgi:hypothetical protein